MRIILATIGSLGDLHPVIALAIELRQRGHAVTIATSANYREKLAALELPFHPLRPDLLAGGSQVIAEIMGGTDGTKRLIRDRIFPAVRDMYDDLDEIASGADVIVGSELVCAAPILAATRGVRWVSHFLAPVSLFSLTDPSILPLPRGLGWLPALGPGALRAVTHAGRLYTQRWWEPVRALRRELGLPAGGHPLFEGKVSPLLNLALFSRKMQPPQPDWPAHTVQTGFLFHDGAAAGLPAEVEAFLRDGEPPVVFTLGSAAVYVAGDFYHLAAGAATALGRRAVLLLGENPPASGLPSSILTWDYLPFSELFPWAAAIVHQGGIGTTAQALRAGRPMLVVPFAHDQFDNAARVTRLGVARTLPRPRLSAGRLTRELAALLGTSGGPSATIAARVRAESGAARAAEAIEAIGS